MGWPSYKTHHDLINQNRFFCQVLIIKETRGRRWPPLPPSICQSLTADTPGSASRRHTVTVSYRRSCTPSPAPQGNVNKGRLVVSRLTSPPAIATDTASSLTGLAYLLIRPSSKKKSADKYIRNNRRGRGARGHCVTFLSEFVPIFTVCLLSKARVFSFFFGQKNGSFWPTNGYFLAEE